VSDYDVVVLGGGPAGLGAAWRAARTGRRVCVLERAPHVGGLAASFTVAGQRVDHGSHRLHPTTAPPVLAALRELLGADLQVRPRHGRIRLAGRFVAFPPRPSDLVAHLPRPLALRLVRDVVVAPVRRGRAGATSFAGVIRSSLGPTMLDAFYAPYVEKLFGLPAPALSPELARRRVGARGSGSLLRRIVRPDPARGVFFYPRRGFGQIPEAIAAAAIAAGAEIRTSAAATALELAPHAAAVRLGTGEEVRGSAVWSTIPLTALVRLACAPAPVLTAAGALRTRALVLVYLALPSDRWTPFDAHYFPAAGTPLSRVSEPKNYRDSPDDPTGVTVLCAELPCSVGDDQWQSSDDDLVAVARDALARDGLPVPAPIETTVLRVPQAYPVYDHGYEQAFATVDAWASGLARVVHFGRQGLFAHDNTHHALAMAWAAAGALRDDGSLDPAAWQRSRREFASHVVED
jgi:protoporphyrinogen oxidase